MAREGGSYLKQKDGSVKLVHRTQPAPQKPKEKPAQGKKTEVNANEIA